MGYCHHRETIVKRWQEDKRWLAILKCRWCSRWRKVEIELSGSAKMKTIKLEEDVPETEGQGPSSEAAELYRD